MYINVLDGFLSLFGDGFQTFRKFCQSKLLQKCLHSFKDVYCGKTSLAKSLGPPRVLEYAGDLKQTSMDLAALAWALVAGSPPTKYKLISSD